jgi:hypothetical protein
MATMGRYCKAYGVEQLKQFAGWQPRLDALAPLENEEDGSEQPRTTLADDDYLFLQENYVVTDGIFLDEFVVFDQVTPEWKAFCTGTLAFEIPDYARADDAAAPPSSASTGAAAPNAAPAPDATPALNAEPADATA